MTDLEQRLRSSLHRHGETVVSPGLTAGIRRRARQLRRRRRAGLALATALLVAVPGTALAVRAVRSDEAPLQVAATPGVVPAPPAPPAAGASVDVRRLPSGPAVTVGYVQGQVWHHADGSRSRLPGVESSGSTQFLDHRGSVLVAGEQGAAGTPYYALGTGARHALAGDLVDDEGPTLWPGLAGTIWFRTSTGLLSLEDDGRWTRHPAYRDDVAGTYFFPYAARSTVWTATVGGAASGPQHVVQRSALDGGSERVFSRWTSVVGSSPLADLVVVADRAGCQDVVRGTTGTSVWHTCDRSVLQLSPDGSTALARGQDDRLVLVDLPTGRVVRALGALPLTRVNAASQFSGDGRVNLVVVVDGRYALVSCDRSAGCWRSAPWSEDRYTFVRS